MLSSKFSVRVTALVVTCIGIALAAAYSLLNPISNGCNMTYMYPTYIPISSPANVSSSKYGLYLYHEGWRNIDFDDHIKKLIGVPVLFIPGNGGSYKQVRSLGAESDRAYQGGPLETVFYQEASITAEERGVNMDLTDLSIPNQYNRMLDWFAVDLEGEHSAMDAQILEEHTEYVVYAIHRILDLYKENHEARVREGAAVSLDPPKSVILVGHSMGGFVARAAVVHPHLRKYSVETILTLSTPHQSPPVAFQPSLGHYYAHVNEEWRKGYVVQTSRNGRYISSPLLSNVIVVSISGGINDYQVRAKLESLNGIVPPANGFMISSSGVKNVWLSMEHQVILWCNQLVIQVSHTLLSLIDSQTGRPFSEGTKRLAIFAKMLRSGVPENWFKLSQLSRQFPQVSFQTRNMIAGSEVNSVSACPSNVQWSSDGLERDLHIETTTVTILAMDGRRRWLDIKKLGSNGKSNFVFVTNLIPCSGIRIHLWPEKGILDSDVSASEKVLEVTLKLVQIPSGPAPRQTEPGSQTEQAPPSSVFWLDSLDMHGYRFLTISVAPSPAISGSPPPAASMAVGQFFNPDEGKRNLSPQSLLLSLYSQKDMILKEDHPLAINMQFKISLGLLPVKLSVTTTGCGIKESGLSDDQVGDMETNRLCKFRCFPPVALAWDSTSGLNIFPNLSSEIIEVDSSPAQWSSHQGSETTTVLLLVDPHCSYTSSVAVSVTAAARRFLLLYIAQIVGFSFAIVFFALMQQSNAWELDLPVPSVLSAVVYNLKRPLTFLVLAVVPNIIALLYSFICSQPIPPLFSFIIVSIICYLFANGSVVTLVSISQLLFYAAASLHALIKKWLQREGSSCYMFFHWFLNLSSSFLSLKVLRMIRVNPLIVTSVVSMALVCFIHPALGLVILLLSHALCCHNALSSSMTASFNGNALTENLFDFGNGREIKSEPSTIDKDGIGILYKDISMDENDNCSHSPDFARSYSETQLEIFHHRHGLLILHFIGMLMFGPSFVAWLERTGTGHSFPWFLDSVLCVGVILHGIGNSKPEFNFFLFPISSIRGYEARLSFTYLLAGYWSFLSGLALAPYRAFYAMATIGFVSFIFRILERRNRERGEVYHSSRKHSHRH